MPVAEGPPRGTGRILVKLRPSAALGAAESRAELRPLHDDAPPTPAGALGFASGPRWFVAEPRDGAATPWDLSHARVADQLGVAESDVLFAEPDLVHTVFQDTNEAPAGEAFAVGGDCTANEQDAGKGKAVGPEGVRAWHLGEAFSQLDEARKAVRFTSPRTRIAHLDTGYFPDHVTTPANVRRDLERNFVERDGQPSSATDPDNRRLLLDNSGHGVGTLSILAGGAVPALDGLVMGGAPEAEIVPVRVADSVVLLRTSALARALRYALEQSCAVVTLSMGGLPSRAWEEAVDEAYEGGVCICAAAGNHKGPTPPRTLVYPARYDRVIAVCGVMADGNPYAGLEELALEGSFGPESAMGAALAAYTPNIPWARFGCADVVRLNGEGTSSATPQVAAAAALWIEKYKGMLPSDWRRVEAVRRALFESAKVKNRKKHFGNGVLQAHAALAIKPHLGLKQSPRSKSSFALLRLVTGLGIVEAPPREQMFNLELAQRWLLNERLQQLVPDPEGTPVLERKDLRLVMEAIIEDEGASRALREHVAARYPLAAGRQVPGAKDQPPAITPHADAALAQPTLRNPPNRRLRVYAVDPSLSTRLATAGFNEVTLELRWEERLEKGPKGEYLSVEDVDAAGNTHQPVDLNDPRLLAQDGWAPSEGNPQFHQQMVYAVAMKTIEHFERALGRPVLWRPRPNPKNEYDDKEFVQRLVIRPHALRQANAFYSPQEVALLFGHFEATARDPREQMPGSRVYTCLSHDIVAHETTHAILDGLHRRFNEPTNVDVLAFHEAFADIVALLQHFTIPEVLEDQISRTRGNIEAESLLGSLAVQLGRAMGTRGALRDAIGRVEDGVWKRLEPDPADLQRLLTPHARGAVLVAAVFDAFLAIYNARIADLLRISTGGTGVLPAGAIHPDLVRRLSTEAAKCAAHVLKMCIRALDYVPPVDLTFFEYLRALITADFELMSDDRHNYRVAFVEAFRRRGIYPLDLQDPTPDTPRTLSVDTLRWQGLDTSQLPAAVRSTVAREYDGIITSLRQYADACFYLEDRKALFDVTREQREKLARKLKTAFAAAPEFAAELGLDPKRSFEVHALHRSLHVRADGRHVPQVVVALTQSTPIKASKKDDTPAHLFRGGSTLVVDLSLRAVKYRIYKNIKSSDRRERTADFFRAAAADPLRGLFFAPDSREPFAALHTLADDGL
jgi:hypothetical protein